MANFNYARVMLGGRLTADPELKVTPSGIPVCNFCIAVTRRGSNGITDFFHAAAWRKTAEFITTYFRRGNSIYLEGTLQTRTWTDGKTGATRSGVEIIADEAFFVDSKREMQGQIVVDPTAEVLEGAEEPAEKPAFGVYNTPGARAEIREGMAEGEPDMPF